MPHSYKLNRWTQYDPWDFVLPTGEQMNPMKPEGAVYFSPRQVVYVLRRLDVRRTRPSRIVTSYGSLNYPIGHRASVFHDQTGAHLGEYEVVGIRDYSTGYTEGEVPNRLIPQSVFK